MKFFWTNEALARYRVYRKHDPPICRCLDDLLNLISNDPDAGADAGDLLASAEEWDNRVSEGIDVGQLPPGTRIVMAAIERPPEALPPAVLAVIAHSRTVPPASKADHSIIALGRIDRQRGSQLR